MNFDTEYRVQTVGGMLMTLIGLLYWLMGGTIIKFSGMLTDENNALVPFIRQSAIIALVMPLAWAIFTIKKERNQTNQWTTRWTIISAIPVTLTMLYFLTKSVSYGRYYPHLYFN